MSVGDIDLLASKPRLRMIDGYWTQTEESAWAMFDQPGRPIHLCGFVIFRFPLVWMFQSQLDAAARHVRRVCAMMDEG